MRKALFFIGIMAVVVTSLSVAACGSDSDKNGGIDLPPRGDASSEQRPAPDSSSTPQVCTGLTQKVSDRPACDTCAKANCCPQILRCNDSFDCTALQECLAPCAQTDFICIGTCQDAHGTGASALQEVGSCAGAKCKAECPLDLPDADLFDGGI